MKINYTVQQDVLVTVKLVGKKDLPTYGELIITIQYPKPMTAKEKYNFVCGLILDQLKKNLNRSDIDNGNFVIINTFYI